MVTGEQPDNRQVRVLPDMQVCRATDLTGTFAECLVEKPAMCQYAMPFGYSYLCGHPERGAYKGNPRKVRKIRWLWRSGCQGLRDRRGGGLEFLRQQSLDIPRRGT